MSEKMAYDVSCPELDRFVGDEVIWPFYKTSEPMSKFAEFKSQFDSSFAAASHLPRSLVPVNGKYVDNISIKNKDGQAIEEYYKWQFVYALLHSGLYPKDYVGVEVFFPKGNANAAALKLDLAIFDSAEWIDYYRRYWSTRNVEDIQWLKEHLIAAGEFKIKEKTVEKIFQSQLKPAMNEKAPSDKFVMGLYYDSGRLFLFQRKAGNFIRLDATKNSKGDKSAIGDLSLQLPDPYILIPDMAHVLALSGKVYVTDRAKRSIEDLELVTSISSVQIQNALSHILRTLDKVGLVNQRGYALIMSALAMKIHDEQENRRNPDRKLRFYIEEDEKKLANISDASVQTFITRMSDLQGSAAGHYIRIFSQGAISWTNINVVRALAAVCEAFQDFSFVRSQASDLYQLVFYNFANQFKRDEAAQFLTPLPVIKFVVSLVNPRENQTVFDPCCGIGDFLSLSYVNSQIPDPKKKLNDHNLFGVDLDESMITLATLNMLLNGDGEARLFHKPGTGSIDWKVAEPNAETGIEKHHLVQLDPAKHSRGQWDSKWHDGTALKKFDVILTNPPFGEDRAFRPRTEHERDIANLYETWGLPGTREGLDLGILFLENAYRCLKENGRLGIVLSNSIASVAKWQEIRAWFAQRMRLVAIFDLPSNVFAETGVNTSILIAYKPGDKALADLQSDGYSVFCRDIKKVGYEKRTRQRNVYFNRILKLDPETFETLVDENGYAVEDEEFSQIYQDFRSWCAGQEETLNKIFWG